MNNVSRFTPCIDFIQVLSLPHTVHQNDWNQRSMFWSFLSSSSGFPILKFKTGYSNSVHAPKQSAVLPTLTFFVHGFRDLIRVFVLVPLTFPQKNALDRDFWDQKYRHLAFWWASQLHWFYLLFVWAWISVGFHSAFFPSGPTKILNFRSTNWINSASN